MMVAFLYVVALCPNPVFLSERLEIPFLKYVISWAFVRVVIPGFLLMIVRGSRFRLELLSISEEVQWLREPSMFRGLSLLIPLLGLILFLCIVRVVCLCNEQKQCLGGHGLLREGSYTSAKREYV